MDTQRIEHMIELLQKYPVSEISLEERGRRILVRAGYPVKPQVSASALEHQEAVSSPEESKQTVAMPIELTAQMVGVFRQGQTPIRPGMSIIAGQIIGDIEAMKLMNEVVADAGGRVLEIMVEDGTPVEYGQPLLRIQPS